MAVVNRRLVLKACGKPLELETDQPVPTAPPGGAVLRVHNVGMCHTDVSLADVGHQINKAFRLPCVLGHEIAGTISSLGEGSQQEYPELAVGRKAVVFALTGCGDQCSYCKADIIGRCQHQTVANAMNVPGFDAEKNKTYGTNIDGGYQDYMIVANCRNIVVIPDDLPLDIGCQLGCGGLTSYNAVSLVNDSIRNAIAIQGNARVALVGSGALSLWAMSFLKNDFPPDKITICAVDIQDVKLQVAKEHGADGTALWKTEDSAESCGKQLRNAAGGLLDAVIDFVASTETLRNIFQCVNSHATVAIVGATPAASVEESSLKWLYLNLKVCGVIFGTRAQLREVIGLVHGNKVKIPPFTVVPFEADAVNDRLQALREGTQIGRAVLQLKDTQ